MKSEQEFKAFYSGGLLPILKDMERERKSITRLFIPTVILPAVLIGLKFLLSWRHVNVVIFIIFAFITLFLGGIFWFIYYMIVSKRLEALKTRFKAEVVAKIVSFIDSSLTYSKFGYIEKSEYKESKLFLPHIEEYSGSDLVSGTIGKTNFRFSEIESFRKTQPGDKNIIQVIFIGMFFVCDFNKNFKTETVVLPDVGERYFGSLGTKYQKMNMSRDEFVKMEDPEFEKYFVVYSKDQIEARYILTPSLMKKITELKIRTNKGIFLSFIHSKIFIAIQTLKPLEPSFFGSLVNENLIREYFLYLDSMVGIVEELDLNTRIWTKE